jgi:hypothetical protein
MYDIPFDRSFLQLSNGIRRVMSSTDTKPELTAKASVTQPVSQPAVYANGLSVSVITHARVCMHTQVCLHVKIKTKTVNCVVFLILVTM